MRSVHALWWVTAAEGCVSLLSLIPHLIMQWSPVRGGAVGVAGWNTSTAEVPGIVGCCHVCGGGRRRARTLLGPEETPVGVVLGAALGLAGLTREFSCGGGAKVGVWLCVECCIVDASILLWLSV